MTDEPIKSMNTLDWLLVILLVYSVVRAFLRGFFQEAFALGGLIFGISLRLLVLRTFGGRPQGADYIARHR